MCSADSTGRPKVVRDHNAERLVRQEEGALWSTFEGILAFAGEAIVTTDSNGLITAFNPAAERVFGYREEEVLGRSPGDPDPVAAEGLAPTPCASVCRLLRGWTGHGS